MSDTDGLEIRNWRYHAKLASHVRSKGNSYSQPLRRRAEFHVLATRCQMRVYTLPVPTAEIRIWMRAAWRRTW